MIKKFAYGGKEGKEAAAFAAKELKKSKDFVTRRYAITALRTLGNEAAPFADAYVAALQDEDAGVRYHAAMAFGTLGPAAAAHAAMLAQALLTDADPGVRLWAAIAIGALGPNAASSEHVVGALEHALEKDADTQVRVAATEALTQVQPSAAPRAAAALSAALREEGRDEDEREPYFRASAAEALGLLGAPAVLPHLAVLVGALRDPYHRVRGAAASTLCGLGPAAVQAAAPALAGLTRSDADEDVRAAASAALRSLDPSGALRDAEAAMRCWAVRTLAEQPSGAEPHAQVLADLLRDADPDVRYHAAVALRGIKQAAAAHSTALIDALQDDDVRVRVAAMRAIVESNPDDVPKAMEVLAASLKSADPCLRACSAEALSHAGLSLKPHAEALAGTLEDLHYPVRLAAVRALESAGRTAVRDSGAKLAKMAKEDPDIDVRRAATSALREHRLDVKFGITRD